MTIANNWIVCIGTRRKSLSYTTKASKPHSHLLREILASFSTEAPNTLRDSKVRVISRVCICTSRKRYTTHAFINPMTTINYEMVVI